MKQLLYLILCFNLFASCNSDTKQYKLETIEGVPINVSQKTGKYSIELLQLTDPYDLCNYQEIKISLGTKTIFQEFNPLWEIHGKPNNIVTIKEKEDGSTFLYFEFNQRPLPANYLVLQLNIEKVKKIGFQENTTLLN